MHWITKLKINQRIQAAYLIGLREGLDDLRSYLLSDKFHRDTTVQVQDVLNRIDHAFDNANELASDASVSSNEVGL